MTLISDIVQVVLHVECRRSVEGPVSSQCGWQEEQEEDAGEVRNIHFDAAAEVPDSPWNPRQAG